MTSGMTEIYFPKEKKFLWYERHFAKLAIVIIEKKVY